MTIESRDCLQINVPHLFQRKDFREWLNTAANSGSTSKEFSRVATWHVPGNRHVPSEYSDVFMSFTLDTSTDDEISAEGSNSDMPEECWNELVKLVFRHRSDFEGLLWLTNLEE